MGNEIMMQAFEWYLPDDGNYYKNLEKEAKNLKEKGIDALWLAPMFKATGTNDVGYGVYDLYDLGEFDQKGSVRTKYGTVEELKKLIEVLHENDIKVYADVILNHKAGADFSETFKAYEVDPNDRTKRISDAYDIEGWTGFDFKGRNGKYSDFVWHFQHFNGVDFDNKQNKKAIFEIAGENKGFSDSVSNEKGNFDYLMFADIDHKNTDVRDELFRWGEWFVNYVNVDGFRYDALKHIDDQFIIDFTKHIQNVVNRDFYFFGEYWLQDKDNTNHYLYDTKYNLDLFDVALHFNMYSASKKGNQFDMRKIFDNTLVQEHPTIAVTFVDNHDSEPGQSLESFVEPWFKKIAYGLILLRKDGYPCVFYGDYCKIGGEYNIEGQKDIIDNLMYIRKHYAFGDQTDYMESENLIGWIRHGDDFHNPMAVVISTGDINTLRMDVGKENAGKKYTEITGTNSNEIVIDDDGFGDFEVGAGTLSLWVCNE